MAKTQKEKLWDEVVSSQRVHPKAEIDEYTQEQLESLLGRAPAWEGSLSASKPVVGGVDKHVHLSQEDLDARS